MILEMKSHSRFCRFYELVCFIKYWSKNYSSDDTKETNNLYYVYIILSSITIHIQALSEPWSYTIHFLTRQIKKPTSEAPSKINPPLTRIACIYSLWFAYPWNRINQLPKYLYSYPDVDPSHIKLIS